MAIPIELLEIQILLALICTAYSWFIHDNNNYTDVIAGLLSVIFWWTSGLSFLNGIQSDNTVYVGSWLMWIFLGIGVIVALITFTKIVDVLNTRKDHVSMDFDHRL
jgi:uncharacterized membrane protein